jgi:hypothetical protein
MNNYILNADGEPEKCDDLVKWALWFETEDRSVARTNLTDDIFVSTVFLGIDRGLFEDAPPVLWETMVFGGKNDGFRKLESSRKAALRSHEKMVATVRKGEGL